MTRYFDEKVDGVKVARLVGGPRDNDFVPMEWLSAETRLHRGDVIRVTWYPLGDTFQPNQRSKILQYEYMGSMYGGAYLHRFLREEEQL